MWDTVPGQCTQTCTGGVQTPNVVCKSKVDGSELNESNCDSSAKPTAVEAACNTEVACEYDITPVYTDVSCTKTCDGGTMTTDTFECKLKGTEITVPIADCNNPDTTATKTCNDNVACTYVWHTEASECSSTCKGGTQTPTVSCVLEGTKTVAEGNKCVKEDMPVPSEVACNENVACQQTTEEVLPEDSASQICLFVVIFLIGLLL